MISHKCKTLSLLNILYRNAFKSIFEINKVHNCSVFQTSYVDYLKKDLGKRPTIETITKLP